MRTVHLSFLQMEAEPQVRQSVGNSKHVVEEAFQDIHRHECVTI